MNDELNKVTTTPEMPEAPDALSDEQIEDVNGGAGNDAQYACSVNTNAINSSLLSANVTASARNNRNSTSRRI